MQILQLKEDKDAIDSQLKKAKADIERGQQANQKCISRRRIGRRDIRKCVKLSGENKQACIDRQLYEYQYTSPEVCTSQYLKKA